MNGGLDEFLWRAVRVLADIVQEKLRCHVHGLAQLNQVMTVPLELNSLITPLNLRKVLTTQSTRMNAPGSIPDYSGCVCSKQSLDAGIRYRAMGESRPLKPSHRTQLEALL